LNAELFYRLRDRDYDADRNGYLYVRGDGSNQPGQAFTVYNSNHDLTSQTGGAQVSYRLPLRSKLSFEYAYEEVERRNAAVEKTQEDRYSLQYRLQPWPTFSSRLRLEFADRAADTYQWAQDYYALLDTELINATPDNQRYINHPELRQYYLANRERWESSVDLGYLPGPRWNANLNLRWRDDNYDQSELGLTDVRSYGAHFNLTYAVADSVSAGLYTGYDYSRSDQGSRAFRGGQEKDAFAVYPPLPQASDPQQDWDIDSTDTGITVGANVHWRYSKDLAFSLDYSFVDTRGEQDLATRPGASVPASDLPNVKTRLHQLQAGAEWQLQDNLSLQLEYEYYSYKTNDWAWAGVQTDTIARVLTFGQGNPDEDIHYLGTSLVYRWQ
jgi:MtrB/PioB family decaheme-associated outer membrane protein